MKTIGFDSDEVLSLSYWPFIKDTTHVNITVHKKPQKVHLTFVVSEPSTRKKVIHVAEIIKRINKIIGDTPYTVNGTF
jgi:hypothetical protein